MRYDMRNVNTITLVSGSNIVIPHKSDGSQKIWIQLTVDGKLSNYYPYGTVSDYFELPTIPRATTPTLNPSTVEVGKSISISLPRASNNFTHKLYHGFYDTTWTEFASGVETSATLVVPISWANKMTDCATSWGQIKCETYSGDTYIGEKIVRFNVELPETMVPTVDSISISEGVEGLAAKFGAYIQNNSKLRIVSSGTGIMGSTITTYNVEVLGMTYTGEDIITNVINQSGNIDVKVTVTDSRGRKGSKTTTIPITAYFLPTIVSFTAFRADSSGNEKNGSKNLKCVYNFKIAPCGNKNNKNFKIEYKKTSASMWTTVTSGAVYEANTSCMKNDILQLEYAYEVRLTLTDYFGIPVTYTVKVGAEVVPIAVYPNGKGIGFGGYPTGEAFQVFMAAQFYKTLTLMDVDGDGTNINLLNRLNEIDDNFIAMSSEETKTHELFLGKPIYTKTFKFDTILSNTVISKLHSISNVDNIWIDLSNSYMQALSNGYSVPVVSNMYYGKIGSGNNWSVAVDKTSFYLYADSGWNDNWVKFITVRYTKTTD